MDRTSFYEWKRRFQTHGIEGLKDLPPVHKSHPQTTPPGVVRRILELAVEHPAWGCLKVSDRLELEGIRVSSVTVRNILSKEGLASKYDRLLALEEKAAAEPIEFTAEQMKALEKMNPCLKERHTESSRPGELLCQDTFFVGTLKGVGRVYLQAVVDTYGSCAFGFLCTSKRPETAAALIYNDVMPFYEDHGLGIGAVLTDNGREFCGGQTHPYELLLELAGLEHRRTKVRTPKTNGFVERFNRTVLDEFFREKLRSTFYEAV